MRQRGHQRTEYWQPARFIRAQLGSFLPGCCRWSGSGVAASIDGAHQHSTHATTRQAAIHVALVWRHTNRSLSTHALPFPNKAG